MPFTRYLAVAFMYALLVPSMCAAQGLPAPDSDKVVAEQGGVAVTFADIDAFAARIPEKDRAVFFNNPERLQAVVSNLLLQKKLAAEARAAGLDNDPAIRTQVALAIDDVLGKARMDQFKNDLAIPDLNQLAKERYLADRKKYRVGLRVDVKHVLVSTDSRSEDEAKKLAETVAKEAAADPGQFDALVEKYSDDPSKARNNGLMPDAGSERYVPEFSKAATALRSVGAISPVVKTKYGFHVLKLVSRTEAHEQSFEEVKDSLVATLRSQFVEDAVKNHTDQFRNLPMEADPATVASLRTRFGRLETPADVEAKAAPATK